MWRKSAIRAARIAQRTGVPFRTGFIIARAAKKQGVGMALAFALFQQESGFRHIFGHDAGGPFAGEVVTRAKYRKLLAHVKGGGTSNGVGLGQITYPGYLVSHSGLWRKRANVKFAVSLIAFYVSRYGERMGLGIYNGGPSNPQFTYADSVIGLKRSWQNRFRK